MKSGDPQVCARHSLTNVPLQKKEGSRLTKVLEAARITNDLLPAVCTKTVCLAGCSRTVPLSVLVILASCLVIE